MATDVRNIVVGAANVFYSVGTTTTGGRPAEPTWSTASSAAVQLRNGSGSWTEAGLTTEGVDLSYEPNYGEIMVDQLLDVAKIFKQSLRVTAKTTLAEATLASLEVAFGNENTLSSTSSTVNLNIPAGALGTEPVERSLVFVSQSTPGANSAFAWGSASANVSASNTERVYFARRVVSMDTVAHSLKRDAATVFPVTFRLLPDTNFAGSEYGKIIDRLYSGTGFTG